MTEWLGWLSALVCVWDLFLKTNKMFKTVNQGKQ